MRHFLSFIFICAVAISSSAFAETEKKWTPPEAKPFHLVEDFPASIEGDPALLNPGNLKMYLHVPADMPEKAPVVVVLHGCMKGAELIKSWTGWHDLADKHKFYVVFPQQQKLKVGKKSRTGNPILCFNWLGLSGKWKKRGEGEDKSILDMISYVEKSGYSIDTKKVFITGFSAGGAMTNLMLAYWPDKFAGGAPLAGVPFRCADTMKQGFDCMGIKPTFLTRSNNGPGCEGKGEACMDPVRKKTPEEWKELVMQHGKQDYVGPYPRVMILHGGRDKYVDDDNLQETLEQWTAVHGIDQKADNDIRVLKETYSQHVYKEYRDKNGEAKVATLIIPRMFHSIPVEPGEGFDQGGMEAGGFAVDYGLHSSYYIARFWGIVE